MMWGTVVEKLLSYLQTDASMIALTGADDDGLAHIYKNRSRVDIQIPSVAYAVLASTVDENEAPVSIQWDVWAQTPEQMDGIELRLFQLMHRDLPIDIGGLLMWSMFLTRFDFADDDQSVYHSAVEYRYTPARENG